MVSTSAIAMFSLLCLASCQPSKAPGERPAPQDPFAIDLSTGLRLTGPAARIDLTFEVGAMAPAVELHFRGARGASAYAVRALLEPRVLRGDSAEATLTVAPLRVGLASAELTDTSDQTTFAERGTLQLALASRTLQGEVRADAFSATFAGPVVLTCSIPAGRGDGASAPTPEGTGSVLVLDADFSSVQCKPYAALK